MGVAGRLWAGKWSRCANDLTLLLKAHILAHRRLTGEVSGRREKRCYHDVAARTGVSGSMITPLIA